MILEPIGAVTLLVGLLMLYSGPRLGIYALMTAYLLGAAAAIKLPALGDSSIPPGHVLLAFYVAGVFKHPESVGLSLRQLDYRQPGFWLVCFAIYGLCSAMFLPRVFAGEVEVFTITRGDLQSRSSITLTPLAFGGGNIAQTAYLLGDVALFIAVSVHARIAGTATIAYAILFAATAHFAFGVLDVVHHRFGGIALFEFIRNANYAVLAEGDIGGIRRTIGSFPESSAFGGVALPFLAFASELYLRGIWVWRAALVASLALLCVIGSMSSSALVGLGIYLSMMLLRGCGLLVVGASSARLSALVVGFPAAFVGIALALQLWPAFSFWLDDTAAVLFFEKLGSASGIERSLWNVYGWEAFLKTWLLGAGVGSIRTSSLPVAVLANTGIPGACLMLVFFGLLLAPLWSPDRSHQAPTVAKAAAFACLAALLPAMTAGTSVVLGLQFAALAALATAGTSDARGELTEFHLHPDRVRAHVAKRAVT